MRRHPSNGIAPNRRELVRTMGAAALAGIGGIMPERVAAAARAATGPVVRTGAEIAAQSGFAALAGRRVGLVTNHTGMVGEQHLADLLAAARGVKLAAILAPEHGFRGAVEAGEKVGNDIDARTGVRVWSLYGATRKPTPQMLADVDVLVFDVQDVGVRFYTYISTMGLAMQAAAARRIPFVVLDRPNPIGGADVSGFMLEPKLKSFVGQYPMPIVHGMTVGEVARMVKGLRWLDGLDALDLQVIGMQGWRRDMRWPATGLGWRPTSPNIPTFEAALVYPGMGLVGETLVNEGRGTPRPFSQCGAPWLDAPEAAGRLQALGLPGVRFTATTYTPRSIPNIAADPRFRDRQLPGVSLEVTDATAYRPLEVGMHVLAALRRAARARSVPLFDKLAMFHATSGTTRLHTMLEAGADGHALVAAWGAEAARFAKARAPYLLY